MNEAVYYLIIIVCMLALMIISRRKPAKNTELPKQDDKPKPPVRQKSMYLSAHEQQIIRTALCTYDKKLNNKVKSNSKNGRQHMNELLTAKIYNVKVLRHKMENYNAEQEHDS